jgi:hypothetical protein
MLDGAYGVCAWILFPTGVTPWGGDDWRKFVDDVTKKDLLTEQYVDTWGAADVQAAVAAIPDWMQAVAWNGAGVSLDDWLVSGHSNGGWRSDRILPSPAKLSQVKVHGFSSHINLIRWSLLPPFPDILRLKV